ncbi:MAG: hypothetical protein HY566_01795 [Candidatus Kerfeldbacteria bacterium]|nr:hypothetical protein [Candidatus Kerfeldbacteria bacterium]
MIRYPLAICSAALAAMVYISLFLALPIFRFVHLPALCLVLCTLSCGKTLQWCFAAGLALTLGLYSATNFLIFPTALAITLLLVRTLYEHFFTNRSIYGVTAMTAVATASLTLTTFAADVVLSEGGLPYADVVIDVLWTWGVTVLTSVALFYSSLLLLRSIKKTIRIRGGQRGIII